MFLVFCCFLFCCCFFVIVVGVGYFGSCLFIVVFCLVLHARSLCAYYGMALSVCLTHSTYLDSSDIYGMIIRDLQRSNPITSIRGEHSSVRRQLVLAALLLKDISDCVSIVNRLKPILSNFK
jgi:hypothetical protein